MGGGGGRGGGNKGTIQPSRVSNRTRIATRTVVDAAAACGIIGRTHLPANLRTPLGVGREAAIHVLAISCWAAGPAPMRKRFHRGCQVKNDIAAEIA